MLKIITPKEQYYYQARIDLLMGMICHFQKSPLLLEEQKTATFILAKTEKDKNHSHFHSKKYFDSDSLGNTPFLETGIYGGAVLHQRNIRTLPSAVQEFMTAHNKEISSTKGDIWGSSILFFMNLKKSRLNKEESEGNQEFYKILLEKFIEFSQQKKFNFLYLVLCPLEYQSTKKMHFWPYLLEIKPEDSPDGLFHGVITLPRKESPMYEQILETTSSSKMAISLAA